MHTIHLVDAFEKFSTLWLEYLLLINLRKYLKLLNMVTHTDSYGVVRDCHPPSETVIKLCIFTPFTQINGILTPLTLLWVFPKIGVPKMDGENNGKPYENGWFWGYHYFRKHPYHATANHNCSLQGGPLSVINGVITTISRVISPQLPIYFRPFIEVMSLHL